MYYETIFIVNPDVSQENTDQMTDTLIQRVEKAGGRIVKREYWGSRPLAYQIAKRKRGHYVLLVTDGEATAAASLEEGLRLDERVMRFLTTRLTELSDEPSPLLRRKAPASEDKPAEDNASEATPAEDKPAAESKSTEDKPVKAEAEEAKAAGGEAGKSKATEDKPAATKAKTGKTAKDSEAAAS